MKVGDICIEKTSGEKVILINELNPEEFEVINQNQIKERTLHNVSRKDLEVTESEYMIPVTYSMYGIQKVTAKSLDEALEFFDEHIDEFPLPNDPQYVDDSYYREENRDEIVPLQY